jgi:hypothetical protein
VRNEYTHSQVRVEVALSAFLRALSELEDIDESDNKTPVYQDRVAVTLDELNKVTYHLLNPNLYRITVRDREGRISSREIRATSLGLAIKGRDETYELIKVERIHPITGKVLGGFYNE